MFAVSRNKEALDIKTERYALIFQKAISIDMEDLMSTMRNCCGRHAIPAEHFACSISSVFTTTINKFNNEGLRRRSSEQLKEYILQLFAGGKLRVLQQYCTKAAIAESQLDNEGLDYLPLVCSWQKIYYSLIIKLLWLQKGYTAPHLVWLPGSAGVARGPERVVSSMYVDELPYAIHDISPLVKDVEYLPGILYLCWSKRLGSWYHGLSMLEIYQFILPKVMEDL